MASPQSPEDLTAAQWNHIVSTIKTEAASGRLSACTWTDAAGVSRSSKITDVRRSEHIFTEPLDPTQIDVRTVGVVGVQIASWNSAAYASNRRWLVTEFDIMVICTSAAQTINGNTLKANGDDALAQAWSFIADGNGNGLSCIFRDQANWTLGGNCTMMNLTTGNVQLSMGDGQTPQIWATITMRLKAEKPISTI